jgi:prolipoprotein diacylglyceryltransferase
MRSPNGKKMSVREKTPVHTETTETSTSTTRTSASERRSAPLAAVLFLYEGFLELPVPVVILSLWLAGAALIGLGVLLLYYLFWLSVELLLGL